VNEGENFKESRTLPNGKRERPSVSPPARGKSGMNTKSVQICPRGRIAAIEPVPRTFQLLQCNVANADSSNIKIPNFAHLMRA
jgi:hypothetical protein